MTRPNAHGTIRASSLGRAAGRCLEVLDRLGTRPRLTVAVILALALLLRVVAIAADGPYVPTKDAAEYNVHAKSIAAGDGYPPSIIVAGRGPTAFRPPVYPYLLAAVYRISGDSITAGRVMGAVLGTGLVLILYLLADALWGRRTALAAAAAAAVFPPLVLLSLPTMSEATFLLLEAAAVLSGVLTTRTPGGSLRWAAVAGVCCGLAALTRSNGSILVVLVALGVLIAVRPRSWRALAPAATLVAVAALTVLPWLVRNYSAFHQVVPVTTQTGFGIAGALNDEVYRRKDYRGTYIHPIAARAYRPLYLNRELNEAQVDRKVRSLAVEWALDHPGYVLESGVLNTLRSLELAPTDPDTEKADFDLLALGPTAADVVRWTFWLGCLLAIAGGAALLGRRPQDRGPLWIWSIPAVAFIVGASVIGLTRYRAPLYPFVALLAALAVVTALERLAQGARP